MNILPIPVSSLDDLWPHVWPHLKRGIEVCGRSREQLAADILSDRARVWIASSEVNAAVYAAWLTEIVTHENKRCLMVFGLGGQFPNRWIDDLEAAMVSYARAETCPTVLFNGSKAWARLMPKCRVVGESAGVTLFEREAA